MNNDRLPILSCIDTQPAFRLIHDVDDQDFPERAAYARALLMRTVADIRSTADFIERRLTGEPDDDNREPETASDQSVKTRVRRAATRERTAVVKWLRNHDEALADRIERGEHSARK